MAENPQRRPAMTGDSKPPVRHVWLLRLLMVAVLVPLAVLGGPRGGGEHSRPPAERVLLVLPFVVLALLVLWLVERRR